MVIFAPEPEPMTVVLPVGAEPGVLGVIGLGPEPEEEDDGFEPAGIMVTRDLGLTSIDDTGIPHFRVWDGET
jgi:hypothetical protein